MPFHRFYAYGQSKEIEGDVFPLQGALKAAKLMENERQSIGGRSAATADMMRGASIETKEASEDDDDGRRYDNVQW